MQNKKPKNARKFNLDARPLHLRLEKAVEDYLREFKPGDRLPSEEELSDLMGVSRATIREVLRVFEERGRVIRKHGVGTFLATNKPFLDWGLEKLESMDAFASRMGFVHVVKDLLIVGEPANAELAGKLQVTVGSPLTVVTRTFIIKDVTVAYIYDAMPSSLVTPDQLRLHCKGSVLEYLRKYVIPAPWYAKTSILTTLADEKLARKMEVNPNTDLLVLDELLCSADDRILNYSRRYYNTRHIHYHLVRGPMLNTGGGS